MVSLILTTLRLVSVYTKYVTTDLDDCYSGSLSITVAMECYAAQPSVLACQQLTNQLRPVVWGTGSKNEFNLSRYLLPWLSRMLDELRAPKNEGGAHR